LQNTRLDPFVVLLLCFCCAFVELGIEQNKLEIARQMKKEGMDDFLISKITGLSLKEIENLID